MLEAAERLAKEERKKIRPKREERRDGDGDGDATATRLRSNREEREQDHRSPVRRRSVDSTVIVTETPSAPKARDAEEEARSDDHDDHQQHRRENDRRATRAIPGHADKSEEAALDLRSLQVPVSKDVAIVLSGRLEDPEILGRANLQLVNLVMTPSPRRSGLDSAALSFGLNAIVRGAGGDAARSPRYPGGRPSSTVVENRLLTPSKYRTPAGRDFGTQTDVESDVQELRDKLQDASLGEHAGPNAKDRKDTTNASRRNGVGVEK